MLDLLLADGDGTATGLSEQLPVTRQAIAKHLGVLDRVGLVHATPAGREEVPGGRGATCSRGRAHLVGGPGVGTHLVTATKPA
jgi:predicted ArsR family transcriptional regulator